MGSNCSDTFKIETLLIGPKNGSSYMLLWGSGVSINLARFREMRAALPKVRWMSSLLSRLGFSQKAYKLLIKAINATGTFLVKPAQPSSVSLSLTISSLTLPVSPHFLLILLSGPAALPLKELPVPSLSVLPQTFGAG